VQQEVLTSDPDPDSTHSPLHSAEICQSEVKKKRIVKEKEAGR